MSTRNMNEIIAEMERLLKDAYQKGWNDAVTKIVGAAQNSATEVGRPIQRVHAASRATDFRAGSAIKKTYGLIAEKQGLTTGEIINALDGEDDKAIRTALHRLRHNKRLIENRDGKWYLTQ